MEGMARIYTVGRFLVAGLLACVLTPSCVCFNIDIGRAIVHTVPQKAIGADFGYKAEFLVTPKDQVRLLVTAPSINVTSRESSGIYYVCDPVKTRSCDKIFSPHQNDNVHAANVGSFAFGERDEHFGLSLAVVSSKTAVVCGPLFKDLMYNPTHNNLFTIGRCQFLPDTNNSVGIWPYRYPNKYIRRGIIFFGMALFGMSVASNDKGQIVIGAPYWNDGVGDVSVTEYETKRTTMMTNASIGKKFTFNGFEVAVGKFCRNDALCFVMSSKEPHPKVHLIKYDNESYSMLWMTTAEQEYSSFGVALCAMDVNADGLADLLVGAPTFTATVGEGRSYDQGRVHVYINQAESNFTHLTMLSGDEVAFSRFGSTISNIGDINRDSIDDLAVGAPLENEGAGAVYIYLGTPNGPTNRHVQKIRGQDFNPTLRSFGSHISRPSSLVSKYGYPDFAVGAPASDTVVFLQTRLIINAQAQVLADPNPVDPVNSLCPSSLGATLDALGVKGCFVLTVCLSFVAGASKSAISLEFNQLDFDVDLVVDKQTATEGSRRARLYIDSDQTTVTQHNFTMTVDASGSFCKNYTALLRQEQIERERSKDVEVEVKFRLNNSKFSKSPAPILNQSRTDTHSYQVKFKNQCGADEQCQIDLSVSGRLLHVPDFAPQPGWNVIAHTRQTELHVTIRNLNETAYGVVMNVNITGGVKFRTFTANTRVLCSSGVGECGNSTATQDYHRLLTCCVWPPLGQNETAQLRLDFLADSVPLEAANKVIGFGLKVTSIAEELNDTDNSVQLNSTTAIVADLRITGWSDPRLMYVQDSDPADVTLTHKLLLTNRGPSFLPPTHLNVSLPYTSHAASDLVRKANVTIKQPGGTVVECPLLLSVGSDPFYASTTSTTASTTTTTAATTPIPTTATKPTTTTTLSMFSTETTTEDIFGAIQPNRRRREASVMPYSLEDTTVAPIAQDSSQQQLKMDCVTARCRVYQCSISTLQPNGQLELNITITLHRSAISFPEKIDTILYSTLTSVADPNHPLFVPWSTRRLQELSTTLKKVSTAVSINIWYIIAGIIGGLLLLLIIAIVAWRLGFFKRTDKAKLEKLKRQSGFYENRNESRRSKRASTSGSQRSAGSTHKPSPDTVGPPGEL